MARKEDVLCFLCGELPCVCQKAAKPTKTVIKKIASLPAQSPPAPAPAPAPAAPTPPPPAKKRAGLGAIKVIPIREKPKPEAKPTAAPSKPKEDPDAEMKRAVTLLVSAGLVENSSIQEHRNLIDLPDTEIRAIMWRQKRAKL